jgi:WD40 repeat protein
MKFSPDDSLLAVGAHDSMVFTYDVANKFAPKHKMRGNSSAITHIDFTLSG